MNVSATPTVKVTVCGPNLRDDSEGTFHIHAAGCADLVRGQRREPEYANGWELDASSRDEVGDHIYADHIAEGSMEPGQGKDDCKFFPCCAKALDAAEAENAIKAAQGVEPLPEDVDSVEDINELAEFERDAYAEALYDIDAALLAFRNAREAVEVLRTAAKEFRIEPFATIVTNYGLLAHSTPVLDQLENVVADASCFYPVSHRAKRVEELAAKHDIELPQS